jgi:hypothetical protein
MRYPPWVEMFTEQDLNKLLGPISATEEQYLNKST